MTHIVPGTTNNANSKHTGVDGERTWKAPGAQQKVWQNHDMTS